MAERAKLVVLASGSGTNLQAIMDACSKGKLNVEVNAVISDNSEAYALQRARHANIPAKILEWKEYEFSGKSRNEYDTDLASQVKKFHPNFVILAGWMRMLTMSFLSEFPMQVINLHPALPGTFPGTNAIKRAYKAFKVGEIENTGVMVHYVPDEGMDNGPVILEEVVPILTEDSLELLEERIHQTEHKLLVKAIAQEIKKQTME